MLKIWGRTNSLNVQKVLLCVEEIGLPYERLDAGLQFGVNDTPAYRALNPNGLVPTIEDDGFILWESNSITRYLAARHAPDVLWPRDPQRRAEAERWMDWQLSVLNAAINPAFVNLIRTPPENATPA
jgi:glutathione S-transferase